MALVVVTGVWEAVEDGHVPGLGGSVTSVPPVIPAGLHQPHSDSLRPAVPGDRQLPGLLHP